MTSQQCTLTKWRFLQYFVFVNRLRATGKTVLADLIVPQDATRLTSQTWLMESLLSSSASDLSLGIVTLDPNPSKSRTKRKLFVLCWARSRLWNCQVILAREAIRSKDTGWKQIMTNTIRYTYGSPWDMSSFIANVTTVWKIIRY